MFGGILTLLQELKVNNIIIGKQFETSENYEKFIQIVKEKKLNVIVVQAGQRINVENNPFDQERKIQEVDEFIKLKKAKGQNKIKT